MIEIVLEVETVGRAPAIWSVKADRLREKVPALTDDDLRAAAAAATPAGHPFVLPPFASTWDGLLDHLGSNQRWQPNARILRMIGGLLHTHLILGKIAQRVAAVEQKARAQGLQMRYLVHVFEGEEDGLLPRLPFELLHQQSFWFRRTNVVGVRLPPDSEACDVRLKPGATVLIASAHVDGREPSAERLAAHTDAVTAIVRRAGFTARTLPDCTPRGLEAAMREGCDALYLACHGEEDLDLHGRLALRGGDVTGSQLGEWLEGAEAAGRRVQAAILCACSSAVPGRRPGTTGMAQHIAGTGRRASAALGFRAPVEVEWALAFAADVFERLAGGAPLDVAVAAARRKPPEDDSQWSLPLLFAHQRESVLTTVAAPVWGARGPMLPAAPRPYFTAREAQLEELHAWRASGMEGLTVLVGEGGVGKSEIARVFSHRAHADSVPVIWLERPDRDLGGCLATMIQLREPGYRPRDGATLDDVRTTMTRALGPESGLLVLDDVECAEAVDTLTPSSRWKVLVTTRQHALVPGARELDVGPLDPNDAVALLAKLAFEGDLFSPEEAPHALDLVEALGRLPLTIEVASGLLRRGESLEDARRIALSAAGDDQSAFGRLAAILARSLASLEPGDEAAWTLIAAMPPAGVTEANLASGLEEPEGRAVRRLYRLRQASLLRFRSDNGRYTMHPLARQVARSRARAGGTWDATVARAVRVVYEVMKWCDEPLERDFEEANRRWKTQRDFIETLEIDQLPVEGRPARMLARALIWADNFRLNLSQTERMRFVEAALVRAKDTETLAHAYQARGALRQGIGEHEGATSDLTTAFELHTQASNTTGLVNALQARALLREKGSDLDSAEADYERAIELSAEANYDLGLANAYMARGALRHRRADLVGATADFERAFEHYTSSRNVLGLANAHMRRGALRETLKDFHGASDDYARALEFYQAMNHRLGIANLYRFRSDLKMCQGDLTGAEEDLLRAIEISTEDREKLGLANAYASLGSLRLHQRRLDRAEADLGIAVKLFSELDNKLGLAYAHRELGKLSQARDDSNNAEAQYNLAIDIHPKNVDHQELAYMYLARLLLRQRNGKPQDAQDLARALELFTAVGDENGRVAVLAAFAALEADAAE